MGNKGGIKLESWAISALLGIVVLLHWLWTYPHALSYQEQYQLFLLTGDYFVERISVAGGLADYLGEFLTQFYYIPWVGATILALLTVGVQRAVFHACQGNVIALILSLIPIAMLLRLQGDESVLLSYTVALLLTLLAANTMKGKWMWADVVLFPLLYWCLGPMAWLYAGLRVMRIGRNSWWMLSILFVTQLLAYRTVLQQYPFINVMLGIGYYRRLMEIPTMMWIIPLVILLLSFIVSRSHTSSKWASPNRAVRCICYLFLFVDICFFVRGMYDKEKYELIRQDALIRHEQWDEVIRRAEKYQVKTAFSSQAVNLALAMKRQLAERMFDFYQSGEDALLMPMIRDLTSDLPTAEAFYRLGMVNSAQRYMFDVQESILNYRKSGRCEKRLAECAIINGKYAIAKKHLALLKKSLFYRAWAEDAETYLYKESRINAHPEWGRLRRLRFKEDFLFSYPEMDKMLGRLFVNNPDNKMALDYFMGQLMLKGDVQGFMQYMGWVQQYGGYRQMPKGYQDAVMCIQRHGDLPGSKYGDYVKRKIQESLTPNPSPKSEK
jgi:hypothetical protein